MFIRAAAAACAFFSLACGHAQTADIPRVPYDEASQLVAQAEASLVSWAEAQRERSGRPAATPVEDETTAALDVLRSDRIDRFGDAIDALDGLETPTFEQRAMAAQLRLSWAEAELIVAEVVLRAADEIDRERGRIGSDRAIGAERMRRQERETAIHEALDGARYFAACFRIVGRARLAEAEALIIALVAEDETNYLSYRLMADVHRMEAEWPLFDRVIEQLREERADSTGLKFLEGAAAVRRLGSGESMLRAALRDDSKFARAQVYVVLGHGSLTAIDQDLEALAEISPHHQLVEWVGPLVRRGSAIRE